MSDLELKKKYLKYKTKYLQLKNFKSIKLFGGTISELDERLLNMLEIDKNLIHDLKKVDTNYKDFVKDLINETINQNPNFNILTNSKDKIIMYISRENNLKKLLEDFKDYLIKYNYFDNILFIIGPQFPSFTITRENITSKYNLSENVRNKNIQINIVKKINVNDFFFYQKQMDLIYLKLININLQRLYYKDLDIVHSEKIIKFIHQKKKINLIIFYQVIKLYISPEASSQFVFYSEEYLSRLCKIFNIELDEALKILSEISSIKTDYQMYFIYCAFHNSYDVDSIIELSNQHKINIELYERFINE